MHKILYIFFVTVFCFITVGCSAYVDTRRQAGQIAPVGQSNAQRIAVCYNPIFNDESELLSTAKEACPSENIEYQDTKYFNCTLFYPNTAFYKCK